MKVILFSVFVAILLIGFTVVIVAFWCTKRARALESKERLAAQMSGMCEPDSEFSVCLKTFLREVIITISCYVLDLFFLAAFAHRCET